MSYDKMILYALYAITFMLLAYIPRNKLKEASMIFLFQLFVTWFLGLLIVELRLISYPVREFANGVNRTSFLYEFFFFPVISIFFSIYYPVEKRGFIKFLYVALFSAALTLPEMILEKYTHLISYIHWNPYYSWITISSTLFITWLFYRWYYKLSVK